MPCDSSVQGATALNGMRPLDGQQLHTSSNDGENVESQEEKVIDVTNAEEQCVKTFADKEIQTEPIDCVHTEIQTTISEILRMKLWGIRKKEKKAKSDKV